MASRSNLWNSGGSILEIGCTDINKSFCIHYKKRRKIEKQRLLSLFALCFYIWAFQRQTFWCESNAGPQNVAGPWMFQGFWMHSSQTMLTLSCWNFFLARVQVCKPQTFFSVDEKLSWQSLQFESDAVLTTKTRWVDRWYRTLYFLFIHRRIFLFNTWK